MLTIKNRFLICTLATFIGMTAVLHGDESARGIMQKVLSNDKTNDTQFTATMKLIAKDGTARESTYQFWRKKNGGDSMSMMKFTAPARDKNIGLLIQAKSSDAQQWLFLPKLNEVKRIAGSGKSKAFMGSDFSYEDLEPKNIDDYVYKMENADANYKGRPCYQIESKAKSGVSSGYDRTQLWIDKEKYIIHKTVFYQGGRILKVLYNKAYAEIGGVWTARQIEMISLAQGHKTVMTLRNVSHNTGVAGTYFTQRYLKRKN